MVTKTTRWSPDTCECVLEYTWDSESPEDSRVHTPTTVVKQCPFHAILGSGVTTNYNTVFEENKRKNYTYGDILDLAPLDWVDLDQSGTRTFKKGIDVSWAWSGTAPNRVMTITVTGKTFTPQQKAGIQNKLDQRFGAGKVILA